jgi:hypothetical protein
MKNDSLSRLRKLAILLDSKFEGPFGIRFGVDAILGFFPILGDLLTNAFSFYIIIQGAFLGCPPSVLVRMTLNIVFENLIDSIPFLGNFFDIFWRANTKNLYLIESYLKAPEMITWRSRLVLVSLFFLSFLSLLILLGISIKLMSFIFIFLNSLIS